jgi:uncharacterized FAD-dependent dehydrogenase
MPAWTQSFRDSFRRLLIVSEMNRAETERNREALIVGAGPAGLFAAISLAAGGVRDIEIIDAGPDIRERREAADFCRRFGDGHPDYESGVGGAGLFSDGKVCLSLEVGGHLEESIDAVERARLLGQVTGVFEGLLGDSFARRGSDEAALDRAATRARDRELSFKYYPVAHIGTDRCGDVIADLGKALSGGGVSLTPKTELVGLDFDSRTGEKIAVALREGEELEIRARHVILAMGKVGADRQAALTRGLGVESKGQPIYAGVRLETDARRLDPLFVETKDPKYSIAFDDGSKIKTHCASEGGEVIELRYSDLPLAGGHNYSEARTKRSGFSILWDGLRSAEPSYETALDLMRQAKERAAGRLLVQRLVDYRAGMPTEPRDLDGLGLSCETATAGDVRSLLPAEFFSRMDLFLRRLDGLAPGFVDETAVIYAPAIEWWMEQIRVDLDMSTSVPGLSVCGDGSGWSQGIVHAAATGILAAEGIAGQRSDIASWIAGRAQRPSMVGT